MKNANLCIFGVKIAVSAYFELIRQLVYVFHGTSIALSVFTRTLTTRPMGPSPTNFFFSELTIFKNANLHIFGLVIAVFAYLKPLGLSWMNLCFLSTERKFFLYVTVLTNTPMWRRARRARNSYIVHLQFF